MNQYKAIFSNGLNDRIVAIEAETMNDAIDIAEGLYIVLNNAFMLMVVDTAYVIDSIT